MSARLAAAFLALILLVTSGVTGGRSYLCLMSGQVRSECCCKRAATKDKGGGARIERADRCCEVHVTDGTRLPATARDGLSNDSAALPLLAILSVAMEVVPARAQESVLPFSARGPPRRTGPPLFISNCSLLI